MKSLLLIPSRTGRRAAAGVLLALSLLAAACGGASQNDGAPSPVAIAPNPTGEPAGDGAPSPVAIAPNPTGTPALGEPPPLASARPVASPEPPPLSAADAADTGGEPSPLATARPVASPEPPPTLSAADTADTGGEPAPVRTARRQRAPDRDLAELAERLRGAASSEPAPGDAAPLSVGDARDFWLTNLNDGSARSITATLRAVSDNAYWFVDEAAAVAQDGIEKAAERFEETVRPALVSAFGDVRKPGIDGDERIVVLHSALDGAAGYFGSKDSFSKEVHPHSNEREMVYMDANVLGVGSDLYMAVLAHELQHAIHFEQDVGEESWVNEGMSELAVEVAGYRILSLRAFQRRPHTQLNYWADAPYKRAAHYSASAWFFIYLAQRIGGFDSLAQLAREPLDGIDGVDSFLRPRGMTFEQVFADWTVANYLDADDDRYGYRDREMRVGPVRTLNSGVGRSDHLPQFSARYYEIADGYQGGVVRFEGDTETRQVGTECAAGPTCWWGGRGDGIDTRLTRAFDLSGVYEATLEFSIWHDIEKGWDYGYVQVSEDGGQSWRILAGAHTTDSNPSGNAYGPGYTGEARGWKREAIDLTPFAGKPILVRFEYVTDDAIYLDGLLIDDVSIPQIGFSDETESPQAWEAEGFELAGPPLAQEFAVQIVEIGLDGSYTVSRMGLDDLNRGEARLDRLGSEVGTVAIVVSPTTEGTRHPASYTLEFWDGG